MADETPFKELGEQLTPEQIEAVNNWLAARWEEPVRCQVCKHEDWIIGTSVISSDILRIKGHVRYMAGPFCAFLPIFCKNCGNTIFLNAIQIGIVPPSPPPRDDSGAAADKAHG